mmetsp:Transcript_14696/g.52315  ORF Transcript_14696/g.52315 Transcript_14696/m.52315 type:complete len:142 (+) Transcript_14696:471-896(+)
MVLVEAFSVADVDSWSLSKYGIPEPPRDARADALDADVGLVVVPGLAFDRNCKRLGQGAGFYDAWLASLAEAHAARGLPRPLLVGVALSAQILPLKDSRESDTSEAVDFLESVPTELHDFVLDVVLSPDGAFHRRGTDEPR